MPIPNDFVQANTVMLTAYMALAPQLSGGANQDKLTQLTGIIAGVIAPERVSEFFEFGYANADLLDAATKEAFADVGAFATVNGFYGLGQDGRGRAMELILRGNPLPKGMTEPTPSAKYAAAAAPANLAVPQS